MGPVTLPRVQAYQDVYNSLGSTYDPQTALIQGQLDALPGQQAAQQSALDQAKVNAFRDIDQSANAKGVLFSGFSPNEQASYIGTKYLPAVANLQTTFANNKATLQGKINDLNMQRQQQAQGIISDEQKALADAQYKNAQLSLSASRAASSAASKAGALPSAAQVKSAIQQGLSSVRGRDGYVSPQDYAAALGDWLAAGLDRGGFNKQYSSFRNPKNAYYDYAIKQAGL